MYNNFVFTLVFRSFITASRSFFDIFEFNEHALIFKAER